MSLPLRRAHGALFRLPIAVVRCALIVRVLDEWWSYLPAGTIEDQHLDLGLSYAQSGWLLALLTVGGLVSAPLAPLADRGHRRALSALGAAVLAAGLVTFATGAPFPVLAGAAIALGAASDLVILPLESALADVAGGGLDRLLGRQHVITWLGDGIGPALLALGAATAVGWRGVFALTAAAFAAFAVVLALTEFPETAPTGDEDGDDASWWRAAGCIVRRREVLLLALAELLLVPLDEAFLGFAVARWAQGATGATAAAAAQLLAAAVMAGGIVGSLVVARRGIDRRRTRAGAAVLVLGALGVALPAARAAQVGAMGLVGFGTALVWAAVHHRTLTIDPRWRATVPTVVGVLSTPSLLLPAAMGAIADRTSISVALAATALLTLPLGAVVLLLGAGSPPGAAAEPTRA